MSNNCDQTPLVPACPITNATDQIPLADEGVENVLTGANPIMKVPVVLAERALQIVVEANIPLTPAATEIKRVTKNVFLNQVKLVPVRFRRIGTTDYFEVTRAKLFVAGFIRKNIEYSSSNCNGTLRDRIADVEFSGFAELTQGDFETFPIIGISDSSKAYFLNECNDQSPRLDKYFFQNLVKYNEQPYGELLGANFYELDYSPTSVEPEGEFSTLREKIVMDLYLKVLQVQQHRVATTRVIPSFPEGTLGI
ncbi:CsxC family protein [Sporosarcina sp. HYO08]|uniref:CsxC family protein n=1 Tax=Sporosarcina sp. HYO08 TaxID=1759557 RepID=UPI000799FFD2|nr:Uracil permease [Sporosarcina sp. HYO08]KXH80085.1 Uracil permease [Sporosarcina sp. HYO08]